MPVDLGLIDLATLACERTGWTPGAGPRPKSAT